MIDSRLEEPELEMIEGSEICAAIDMSCVGMDNVCRPVNIFGDEEEVLSITIGDARRLLEFLNDAIPYLEAQAGMVPQ